MFNLVCLPQAHLAAVNPRVGGHATKVENIKGVVGVNKARVEENCFFVLESWEKNYYEKI
jgi:hypothetical protein